MLDQSFSAENFFKISGIENRRGSFNKELYSDNYLKKHQDAKDKYNEIITFKKSVKGIKSPAIKAKLKALNEQKNAIDKEKDEILLSDLIVVSEKVYEKLFQFNLTTNSWDGKTVYTIDNTASVYYAMKQLQYNLRKTFKVSQANRYAIVKQLKILLMDNFPKFIVRTDIKEFYESIPQKRLIEKINENTLLNIKSKKLISSLLREYNGKKELVGPENSDKRKGIPRGVGVSAYLAEFYMKDIDSEIRDLPNVIYYARYVDDIIVIFAPNNKKNIPDYLKEIRKVIESPKYDLRINVKEKKTEVIDLVNFTSKQLDFQYLGYKYTFNKEKFKEVKLSDNKVEKIKKRIFQSFRLFLKNCELQPVLAKWLLFHQISFLSGNTRLHHNKNNILIGIYYSHSLLEDDSDDLLKLDRFLEACIKRYIKVDDLTKKLHKFSFQDGFRTKRFSKFRKNRIPDFRTKSQKEKRSDASGIEKLMATWTI